MKCKICYKNETNNSSGICSECINGWNFVETKMFMVKEQWVITKNGPGCGVEQGFINCVDKRQYPICNL